MRRYLLGGFFFFCFFSPPLHFAPRTPHARTHSRPFRLIAAPAAREGCCASLRRGSGGSGVGICTAACDGEIKSRGWRGGSSRQAGALTPLSLLRLENSQALETQRHRGAGTSTRPAQISSINHMGWSFRLWHCLPCIIHSDRVFGSA